MDSFESDGAAFAQEKPVDMLGDGHLGDVFNPTKGKDRVGMRGEQYDTHTWSPGTGGTRHPGQPHTPGPVPSETAARVASKLA